MTHSYTGSHGDQREGRQAQIDKRRAALFSKNVESVFKGTEWFTEEALERLCAPPTAKRCAAATWRCERKLFAVQWNGRDLYPRYAFSDTWKPVPALARVLAEFREVSDMRIASWFESTNSYLGGMRPRDLLATRPDDVVAAAKAHMTGPVHG